jgi:hypothetical protein
MFLTFVNKSYFPFGGQTDSRFMQEQRKRPTFLKIHRCLKPCKNSEDNFIANTLKHCNVEQIMGEIYVNGPRKR